ncbi:hypothetical protein [Ferruginibacter profundus]
MKIMEYNPETWFIEMIANCLAEKFIRPLFLLNTEKNYAAYVGGLAEILDWAIEFYNWYYEMLINREYFEQPGEGKFKTADLKNLIVAFGNEKMETFNIEYAKHTAYFIEKFSTIEL